MLGIAHICAMFVVVDLSMKELARPTLKRNMVVLTLSNAPCVVQASKQVMLVLSM